MANVFITQLENKALFSFFFQSNKELSILLLLRIPRQSEAISRAKVNISKSYSNTKQMPWKKKNGGNLKSGL